MQTTDPRRTPRPDSAERTPKPDAAGRPFPARRRAPQRRGPSQSTLVFAAVLVVIVLVAVLVLVLVSRHDRAPKNDPAALFHAALRIPEPHFSAGRQEEKAPPQLRIKDRKSVV